MLVKTLACGGAAAAAEALPLAEAVLASRLRVYGPDNPGTVYAMQALAGVHLDLKNYAEALALCRRTYEVRLGLYTIVTSQYSLTTLYQISHYIR
jgi:hypothetical protein